MLPNLERDDEGDDDDFISNDTTAELRVRQWFSKCGPGTNSISNFLGSTADLLSQKLSSRGLAICILTSTPTHTRWFSCTQKFENYQFNG